MASLYQRLEGLEAIASVADVRGPLRRRRPDQSNIRAERCPATQEDARDQVCEATGRPCTYTGRDMQQTHDGMGVTAGEFDALVEDLMSTFDEFEVPSAKQEVLLGLLAPMRGDIVEVESPETRTQLPWTYETAPAVQ